MFFNQRTNNIFRTLHSAIIAVILIFVLAGCGYKTAPVYVPPTDSNSTLNCGSSN